MRFGHAAFGGLLAMMALSASSSCRKVMGLRPEEDFDDIGFAICERARVLCQPKYPGLRLIKDREECRSEMQLSANAEKGIRVQKLEERQCFTHTTCKEFLDCLFNSGFLDNWGTSHEAEQPCVDTCSKAVGSCGRYYCCPPLTCATEASPKLFCDAGKCQPCPTSGKCPPASTGSGGGGGGSGCVSCADAIHTQAKPCASDATAFNNLAACGAGVGSDCFVAAKCKGTAGDPHSWGDGNGPGTCCNCIQQYCVADAAACKLPPTDCFW